jgi:two-component system, cell cycle sensor histidine kinase and response regulator CckA
MSAGQPIRVLFVEDRQEDAELASCMLRKEGLEVVSLRVSTEEDYLNALRDFVPDVIISDYAMLCFDGPRALQLSLARDPDFPFIVLTGSINEETAVSCLKAGATDYVLKPQMGRLAFAVGEALAKYRALKEKSAAEDALTQSERVLRLLTDSMSDTVWLFDPHEGRFTYVSPSVERLLGYSADEFLQFTLEDVVPPDTQAQLLEQLERTVAAFYAGDESARLQTREVPQIRKDGSIVPTEIAVTLISDDQGRLVQIQGTTRDITHRVKTRKELQQSEEKFLIAFSLSPVCVMLCTRAEGRVIDVNPTFCEISGYSKEEAIGRTTVELGLWGSDTRERALDALVGGGLEQMEIALVPRSGRPRTMLMSAVPIEIDGVPCLLATASDITDRKRAEEGERQSEERWRSLVESAPDGIVVHSDGVIQFANAAMARLVGASDAERLIGASVMEFIAPEDREAARARIAAYCGSDVPGPPVEEYCLRCDGEKVPVEATDVRYPFGGQGARLVFIRDRSERVRAEGERSALAEQLQQAHKMESVGLLAGGVAHDFNNILMVQKGYCELMRSDLRLDAPILDGLAQIEACADRATALTRQLLAFSRKQVLQPVVLDVNGLIRDMEDMLRRVMGEAVELEVRLTSKPALVKADPMQLEQVFVNLAANARDAMPEGGSVTIDVSEVDLEPGSHHCRLGAAPGRNITIAVADDGIGMDAETQRRIFEPFFTTKTEGKGTGLGLSTVYGVVQQSGGTVSVESEPGRGTIFRVFMPQVHDRLQRESSEEGAVPSGRGELILVVEDEPVLRGLVQLMVESIGYRAKVASNGAEAKALILEDDLRPDLLLTDVVMPGMSGAALVEEVRRIMPDLRFIFMSGYPDTAIARHRIPNAAFDFLQKPFSIRDLANKIETVLGPTGPASNKPEV